MSSFTNWALFPDGVDEPDEEPDEPVPDVPDPDDPDDDEEPELEVPDDDEPEEPEPEVPLEEPEPVVPDEEPEELDDVSVLAVPDEALEPACDTEPQAASSNAVAQKTPTNIALSGFVIPLRPITPFIGGS
jgi:hypothetical protein